MGVKMRKIFFLLASLVLGPVIWIFLLLKDRRTQYVISDKGIGDIFPTCGFLPAYKKAHGIKHVTVIGIKGKEQLYEMYKGTYDRILYFSENVINVLMYCTSLDLGYALSRWSGRIISTRVGSNSRGDYINRIKTLSYLETIKYGVFDLSDEDKLQKPKIPKADISRLIQKYGLQDGKTVILNPYANSVENIDISFFENLAFALKHRGYQVVTNLSHDRQQAVAGTEGIICSLAEAYYLANYCGYVVGVRSGFMDFISYADCRIVALFPEGYPFFESYRLSKWGIKEDAREMIVNNNWSESICQIMNYLENE